MIPPFTITIRVTGPDGATGNARGQGSLTAPDGRTVDAPLGLGPLAGIPIATISAIQQLIQNNHRAALLAARGGQPAAVRDDIDLRRAAEAEIRASAGVDDPTLTTSAGFAAGGE